MIFDFSRKNELFTNRTEKHICPKLAGNVSEYICKQDWPFYERDPKATAYAIRRPGLIRVDPKNRIKTISEVLGMNSKKLVLEYTRYIDRQIIVGCDENKIFTQCCDRQNIFFIKLKLKGMERYIDFLNVLMFDNNNAIRSEIDIPIEYIRSLSAIDSNGCVIDSYYFGDGPE